MRLRTAAALLLCTVSVAHAEPKHKFTVEDMLAMQRVAEPSVSPDGKLVAYSLRTTEVEANRGRTDVWVAKTDGTGTRRLTSHLDNDSAPRWSADGKTVYFLSSRGGGSQIWRIAVDGGEAEQVTKLPLDVNAFVPVGDGRFVVAMDVYPDAGTLEDTVKRDAETEANPSKAMAFDQLMIRHWDTWFDGKQGHLFVWQDGKATDLMRGMKADAPTRPYGGPEELAISADKKTLVFCAKDDGPKEAWTTNVDLWAVGLDGARPPERLTAANQAWDGNPVFSPDGKTLAYLAMARPVFEADRKRVVLMDWATRKSRTLTEAWDRSPDAISWARDGKSLLGAGENVGQQTVFKIDVASGKATALTTDGTYGDPNGLPGGALLAGKDTLASPVELVVRQPNGTEKAITAHNAARVAAIDWGAWEQFKFKGAKGDDVYGFLVRPGGHKGEKLPVAVLIHGGPQGSFGNHFHYRWNPQAYAGRGYGTIMIDFHGSTGYGQAFTDAIRNDWGGAPYEDIMKGLEFALGKYPFLDGDRVVALGASYGGYMINWLNGHTDRFKAFVCHDGNLDEHMAYYNTEELWFPEWEHGGVPWENPEGYDKHSPMKFVKNWKTPTLVVHGGRDYRIADSQGMATFTALQRKGIPSRFLYFPDENHWVLKPLNSRRWHQEVLDWIDRWAKR